MATWLVTGANRGIGLELARQLRARGDHVIGAVRDPAAAGALRELGVELEALDVADEPSIVALGDRLRGRALDVLVNNAGIGDFESGLAELTGAALARFFAVNATGPVLMARTLLPQLRAGRMRKIAHVSSDMGSIARNLSGGAYGYRASKAALNMLNVSLAHELRAEGFTSIALNPGWLRTDMGGPAAPLDVATGVRDVVRLIDGATPAMSGGYVDRDGTPLPW